ncbi:MAG: Mpo1-like protein [Burkholderiaceae bacterium]
MDSLHPTPPGTNGTPSAGEAVDPRQFQRFADFYPFYLREHSNRTCRRLHFVGSTLALVCLAALVASGQPGFLLLGLVCGYGFAWMGHFGFEKNKPASFKRPLYSFMGDWVMYKDLWTGKIPF